jgi:hypothetical protein
MSLLAYWISVTAMVALDHAMRTWTRLPHRWGTSLASVIAAFAVAWGVWLLVGRHGSSANGWREGPSCLPPEAVFSVHTPELRVRLELKHLFTGSAWPTKAQTAAVVRNHWEFTVELLPLSLCET